MVVLLSVFALQQVLQGYMFLQEEIPIPDSIERTIAPYKEMIEQTYRVLVTTDSIPELLFVVLVIAVVPAIAEELLFRGLIQSNLEQVFKGPFAAVTAGLVFAAYHLVPFTFVPLAILGIYFGYIVYRSQNLTLAIAAHFFNNFLACVALYFSLDEDFVAMAPLGEAPSALIAANSVFFLLVFIVSARLFFRMTARPETGRLENPA
jgi:membrane protease YdiL (CAAX protease family)